jgi:hypothetical protein
MSIVQRLFRFNRSGGESIRLAHRRISGIVAIPSVKRMGRTLQVSLTLQVGGQDRAAVDVAPDHVEVQIRDSKGGMHAPVTKPTGQSPLVPYGSRSLQVTLDYEFELDDIVPTSLVAKVNDGITDFPLTNIAH